MIKCKHNFDGVCLYDPVPCDLCSESCNLYEPQNLLKVDAYSLLFEVRAIANDALYFNDNSDYETALWEILKKVVPDMFDEYGNLKEVLKYSEN